MLGFIGRQRELAELAAATADARAGRGGVWLIAGEPGIGKSRLAEEAARAAERDGMCVAWGRCWESGGAPAYWPWLQVLRAALRARGDGVPRARELGQLLPPGARVAGGATHPEQARFELHDAVVTALTDCARDQPLLIVLEDLHVADTSSLVLLSFAAGQLRTERVLVLGTFRESDAGHRATGELLLRIAQDARTIPLAPLSRADVAALLRGAFGREPPQAVVDRAYGRTEGNALFLVELARWLVAHRGADDVDALPPTLVSAIRKRIDALPVASREALELAAVIGREFSCAQIADSFAAEPDDVRRALEPAVQAALALSAGGDAYRFAHILIREVLYDEVAIDRREALHLACGRALQARHGDVVDAPWSEIAHHYACSGERGRSAAVDTACRAARASADALAFEDAAAAYQLALDALDASPQPDPARRAEILIDMARALLSAGAREGGQRLCREAADLAQALGDPELLARAALARGSVMLFAEVDSALVALLDRAAAALGSDDSALRARVLARLAAAQQPARDPSGPIALAHEAIEMARRVGDPAALLDALRSGCSTMMDLEVAEVRYPLDRELVALAESAGAIADALQGRVRLVVDCWELGDARAANAEIEAACNAARSLDHPRYLWRAAALEAGRALWTGRFDDAERLIARARELGESCADSNAYKASVYQRARLYRLTGRRDELVAATRELAAVFRGSPAAEAVGRIAAAPAAIECGVAPDVDAPAIDAALALGDDTVLLPFSELARATGDRALAQRVEPRLAPRADRFASTGVIGLTWDAPLHRALALCAVARGRQRDALGHFDRGIAAARERGGAPMVAWQLVERAEVARECGDREAAGAGLDEAAAIAGKLGMRGLLERIAALGGAELAPAPPAAVSVQLASFSLRRDGDTWTVEHAGRSFHVRDTKGVQFLARLVDEPGREVHVLDLVSPGGGIDTGDAGELLDAEARAQYGARVRELNEQLEQAESWNDPGRAQAARRELEMIEAELGRAFGLGGRERRSGAATERARINVQRRIRDALRRIAQHDETLAKQLERAVRTGTFCSFDPI